MECGAQRHHLVRPVQAPLPTQLSSSSLEMDSSWEECLEYCKRRKEAGQSEISYRNSARQAAQERQREFFLNLFS